MSPTQKGKTASTGFRLQQLKQADIKRLQQAQAQAQAAQVQAQAQAQAAQQQVTAQTLQAVQKAGGVTATVVGTTAATVVSATQAQLTAQRQQVAKVGTWPNFDLDLFDVVVMDPQLLFAEYRYGRDH